MNSTTETAANLAAEMAAALAAVTDGHKVGDTCEGGSFEDNGRSIACRDCGATFPHGTRNLSHYRVTRALDVMNARAMLAEGEGGDTVAFYCHIPARLAHDLAPFTRDELAAWNEAKRAAHLERVRLEDEARKAECARLAPLYRAAMTTAAQALAALPLDASLRQHATRGEALAASRLVALALADGLSVSVNDGEEWTVSGSRDLAVILAALATTGADNVRFRRSDASHAGTVGLIYGNASDGSELIADYSLPCPHADYVSDLFANGGAR